MKKTLYLFIFLTFFHCFDALASENWNVRLYKKENIYKDGKNLYLFNEDGFYLYKNCVYTLGLNNGNELTCKLINIKQDTLVIKILEFQNNINFEKKDRSLRINEIKYFKLLADSNPDRFSVEYFDDYIVEFLKEENEHILESKFKKIYTNEENLYELLPRVTYDEIDYLYISYGNLYENKNIDLEKADTIFESKDYFWFTPNYVNEINGLALGVWTSTLKNKKSELYEPLIVNGVNLELNPIGFIIAAQILFFYGGPINVVYPDSLEDIMSFEKNKDYIINGFNFNYALPTSAGVVNGFNLIGGFGKFNEINGLSISGLFNYTYVFNGVNISSLYNRSVIHNGVQIGLVNKANKLNGIQIGLWNIHNKRSLPFINWNFSD